jgi:hypothetical protein
VNTGIRHPEELSFCKPLDPNHLKYNLKDLPGSKKRYSDPRGGPNNGLPPADTNTFIANSSPCGSTGSLDKSSPPFMCAPVTPTRHHTSTPISSPVNTVSPAFIQNVHLIIFEKIIIIIHEHTKCSLKRYSEHCLKVDRWLCWCYQTQLLYSAVGSELFIWCINPLNAKLNPICHLLALFGAHHILHVSRIRFKVMYQFAWLTVRVNVTRPTCNTTARDQIPSCCR